MVKVLLFVPEFHNKAREKEAGQVAQDLKANEFGRIKLFIEGVRPHEVADASKKLGFPVTSVEHPTVKAVMNKFSVLHSLLRVNACLWAITHPSDAESQSFLQNMEKLVALTRRGVLQNKSFDPSVSIRDILELVYGEAEHCAGSVIAEGVLAAQNVEEVIDDIQQNGNNTLSPKLGVIFEKIQGELQVDMGAILYGPLDEVNKFFLGQYGFAVKMDTEAYGEIELQDSNPISLEHKISSYSQGARIMRELYMAYCIAREEFDIGVLNIGINHMQSRNLLTLLVRAGIETKALGERKEQE